MSGSRNVLVDGNNLLHRAHAVFVTAREDDPLISPSGYPTGLIYGFLSMLSDWLTSISLPTRLDVFFDGVPRRRLLLDPSYKLKEDGPSRPGSSPAFIRLSDGEPCENELDVLKHLFLLMGCDVYYHPDEEADDLIASYVHGRPDDVHIVVSSDRDFYQMMAANPRVVLYRPGSHGVRGRFFDAERSVDDMREKFGVPIPPSGIRMFKALTGDSSDNVPGVPRLRKKVAAPLCHCTTVDELIATGLPGFSKGEREKVMSLKDRIAMNLDLVALDTGLDVSLSRTPSSFDYQMASKILREDLGITTVLPSLFSFGRKPRQGGMSSYDMLPDCFKDI